MSTTNNERFYCYSTTLMHFLKANGLRYIYTTTHNRTGNRMWVFERTDELRSLLDEYDARKTQARREGRLEEAEEKTYDWRKVACDNITEVLNHER